MTTNTPDKPAGGTPDHSARAHARRSPSGFGSLSVCLHFQNDNSRPAHPMTLAGERIHQASEVRSTASLTDPVEVELAQKCIDYFNGFPTSEWTHLPEMRFEVFEGIYGFADLTLLHKDMKKACLQDLKTGYRKAASAETNIQMQMYTLGIFDKWPSVEEVEVHLIYPRLDIVDVHTWKREPDYEQIKLRVIALERRAEAVQKGELVAYQPDSEICQWCKHAGTCPALHQLALPVAQAYASARPEDLTIPDAYDPALITDPSVMGKAYVLAGVMEKWCESVKFHATQMRLEQGIEIPGTQLAHRAGKKSISDPNEALRIAEQFGISHDEFMTAVEVSGPKLLKIAHDKAPKGKKKVAEENLENALQDAGVMSIGNETLYLKKSR